MTEPTDSMAPWTIKSVSTTTRDTVTRAARREGLTVGQWLERRVAEWEGAGSPVPVSSPPPAGNMGELAALMQAARDLAEAAKVPVPESLARSALVTLGRAVRQARGLPPPQPRKPPAIEGS